MEKASGCRNHLCQGNLVECISCRLGISQRWVRHSDDSVEIAIECSTETSEETSTLLAEQVVKSFGRLWEKR